MSATIYQVIVLVHLLSAITWVGGTLFLVMVMVPLVRSQSIPSPQGAKLLGLIARRFRPVSWVSITLLVLTGLYLATHHWGVGIERFFYGTDWFVKALQMKVGLVLLIIVISGVHDFIIGPRLSAQMENLTGEAQSSPSIQRSKKSVIWLARANVVLVLIVLGLAVSLTRGSPI